jgi:hypothetical protein
MSGGSQFVRISSLYEGEIPTKRQEHVIICIFRTSEKISTPFLFWIFQYCISSLYARATRLPDLHILLQIKPAPLGSCQGPNLLLDPFNVPGQECELLSTSEIILIEGIGGLF